MPRPKRTSQLGGKRRPCLGCGRAFWSSWAGHRVCPRCARRDCYLESERPRVVRAVGVRLGE